MRASRGDRRVDGRAGRRAALALVCCLLAGLAWGLITAFAASPATTPAAMTVLRVGWTDDPETLNPFVGQTGTASEIYDLNYDFLTRYDPATLTLKPALATAWSHSRDGKTWTFSLRRGVTWQDGRPFTASDVVFTYDYVIDNDMAAFTSYTTFIKQVVAVNPYTVRFVCSRPKANMLALAVPILPAHIWSHVDPNAAANSYPNNPPVIGTGPFQVVEYQPDRFVRLVPNKRYWRGAPKVDELIFEIYQDPDTMQLDLRSGAIDAAVKLPLASLKALRGDRDLNLSTQNPQRVVNDLGFNCYGGAASLGNPVLLDPAFRRALNYAIDKQEICRVAYFGLARPGTTALVSHYWVDPDWHWTPPAGGAYPFDLTKAGDMLTAAGYPLRKGVRVDKQAKPITLRLWAISTEPNEQAAGRLIAGWLSQIGLKVSYQVFDTGTLMDRMWSYQGKTFAPDYDLFLWGWNSELDPNFTLSVFTTSQIGTWSDTNWSNAEYDRLFTEQEATIDPAKRQQIVDRMQELMYRQSPMIFLAEPSRIIAWNVSRWEGWVRSPAGVGAALGTFPVIDSYLFVQPRPGSESAKGSSRGVELIVAAAAILFGAGVALAVRRARLKPAEEVRS